MRKLLLALVLIGAPSSVASAQTLFTVFPGTRFCTEPIPHSAIVSILVPLTAGTTNHFLTAGTGGPWFSNPDPVMILISPAGTVARFNDDFVGLDSDIVFTPATSGTFRLIVHAFATPSAGATNVLLSVNGGPPTTLAGGARFGGTSVLADWNPGIRFVTAGGTGDTVLLLFGGTSVGSPILFNDDLGAAPPIPGFVMGPLNSSITPPFSGHGGSVDNAATRAILGSFSANTEGVTVLCQAFRSWMSPLLSPPHDAPQPAPVPSSPTMSRYLREYQSAKPGLEKMKPDERDKAILELQRRVLPEHEIRLFSAPASFPTAAYVRAQDEYLAAARSKAKELEGLDHDRRAAALDKLKAATVGRALLRVEPDYGIPLEPKDSTSTP